MPKTMMVAMVELRDEAGNKRTVNVIADQTTKELVHDLKAVAEKATTDISIDAAEVKQIAEEVSESYETIFDRLSTVESIAKGRSTGYVFDTKADMDTALQQEAFVSKLIKGDNLYIRDLYTPDYWWDGEQAYELETQKVDLSEYYTKEEIELELKPLEQLKNDVNQLNKDLDEVVAIGSEYPNSRNTRIRFLGSQEKEMLTVEDLEHYVKDTDIATETKAGLLLNNSYNVGLQIEPSGALAGQLCIKEPADSMLKERLGNGGGKAHVAITPSKVDSYILAHLTDGLFRAYTPDEQTAAQIRLGILSSEGVGF